MTSKDTKLLIDIHKQLFKMNIKLNQILEEQKKTNSFDDRDCRTCKYYNSNYESCVRIECNYEPRQSIEE